MENSKILTIVGAVLILMGAVVSYFAKFETADISGFAITMFGAGLSCANLYKKRSLSVKSWISAVTIAIVGIGGFILGFGGMSESTMTNIVSLAVGLASIFGGLIATTLIQSGSVKSEEV